MTIDRRAVWVLLIALVAIVLIVAVARGPFGYGDGVGPGGDCPPGHVTSTGCAKP